VLEEECAKIDAEEEVSGDGPISGPQLRLYVEILSVARQ